jgi:hypothetical protein
MEKYYEMFRAKNQVNKNFFGSPTAPTTRTMTRTQMGELGLEEVRGWVRRSELSVRKKPVLFIKITVSHLLRLVAR